MQVRLCIWLCRAFFALGEVKMDTSLFRDSFQAGVDPLDVMKVQHSVITGLLDRIKRKLKDLWDGDTVPLVGTLLAAVAAPLYAIIALTN